MDQNKFHHEMWERILSCAHSELVYEYFDKFGPKLSSADLWAASEQLVAEFMGWLE